MIVRLMTFVGVLTTAAIPAQGGGAQFEAVDGQFGNAFAQAISGDGHTIGGGIIGPLYYAPGPTFWNEPQTPVGVTTYNGGEVGFIRALTPDGRFGVGLIRYDPIVQAYGPFLWDLVLRQAHPLSKTASNSSDAAYGINHDGSVIVGGTSSAPSRGSGGISQSNSCPGRPPPRSA